MKIAVLTKRARLELLLNTYTDKKQCRARRQQLSHLIGDNGIAIIPAGKEVIRNNDVHYRFRQQSDFYYLTAFPEPDAIAVLIPGHPEGEYILFCREHDPKQEQWTGPRSGQQGAVNDYGADKSYPLAEINTRLPKLLRERQQIYYSLAHDRALDQLVNQWLVDIRQEVRRGVNAPWQIIDIDHYLHEMRLIKGPQEIELMQKACEISSKAHIKAMQHCQADMYEYELLAEISYIFQQHGCMHHAYDAIVGAGKNGCILHYIDNNDRCHDGDLVLIDAGAEYQGYAADITRTFPVNGRFSPEQKAVYEIVLNAQVAALELIKPGVAWNKIQETVINVISQGLIDLGLIKGTLDSCLEEKSYQKFYMHNFGHWLGMDVHDVGTYKIDGNWRQLEAGMVLTVEPGIYIAADKDVDQTWWNIGIRIEDDILVTKSGCESLSDVPKTIDDIEAIMND